MKAAMPVLIQHGHVFFQGEAWLTLSKCRLSELKDLESEGGKDEMVKTHTRIGISTAELSNNKIRRSTLLKRCAKDLKHATDTFEMIGDVRRLREVYYLQAQVYHLIPGHVSDRNNAAQQHQEMNNAIVSSVCPARNDFLQNIVVQ